MIPVDGVTFKPGTEEELLPQFHASFPYVCTCLELPNTTVQHTPWHWHKAIEIFYIDRGQLTYSTPSSEIIFPAGSGGLVNSNILHSAKVSASDCGYCGLYHFFDPSLIAGDAGSRIEKKYVLPLLTASQMEIIPLMPDNSVHTAILTLIRDSFQLSSDKPGYELQIRNKLTEIWLQLLELTAPQLSMPHQADRISALMQTMQLYIHEHYGEKITVTDIARSAGISEYMCSSTFRRCLHTTPMEYLGSYRMRIAYQMLAQTDVPVREISPVCGMNNSYFSKVFRQHTGYSPLEYRRFYQRKL